MREIVIDGKSYTDFKVGADPEMRIRGMNARPYLPEHGAFGTDGPNSKIAELRPSPHYDPINLVFEVQSILRDGYRRFPRIQKIEWLGGTYQEGCPIGGHIHFESPYRKDLELKLDALDRLLAPVVLMLEETQEAIARRGGSQYGKLALTHTLRADESRRGFHIQESYGGFEYRPLGSWLVSRQIAAGILSLGKVIVFEASNDSLKDRVARTIKYIERTSSGKFDNAYMNCEKLYFAKEIPTIHRIVSNYKLFPKYEKYINVLFHLIEMGRTWDSGIDIKRRWNIVQPSIMQGGKSIVPPKVSLADIWGALEIAPAASSSKIASVTAESLREASKKIAKKDDYFIISPGQMPWAFESRIEKEVVQKKPTKSIFAEILGERKELPETYFEDNGRGQDDSF